MKLYNDLNDYELLYMISENDETALNILLTKYTNFIILKLRSFNFSSFYFEEMIQEGQMALMQAIKTYKDEFNKTFLKYYELLLVRHFYRVLKIQYKYENIISRNIDLNMLSTSTQLMENNEVYQTPKFNSEIKQLVYREILVSNRSIASFCEQYQVSRKKIYNIIFLLKQEIRKVNK